jgi:hypothetical protein
VRRSQAKLLDQSRPGHDIGHHQRRRGAHGKDRRRRRR